jgi:phosphatidate cytidylyltransferase
MNKLAQRLLMFIIGVPLTIGLVLLLPHGHHLAVNLVIVILSGLGAAEFAHMLKHKRIVQSAAQGTHSGAAQDINNAALSLSEAGILGGLIPAAMTILASLGFSVLAVSIALTAGAAWLLITRIFYTKDNFQDAINQIVSGITAMIYPGLFMAWIIRMSLFPNSSLVILMFLLTVFANDSAAWAVGMLFGRGNQGIILASPNKSAAGFIGGFTAALIVGIGGALFIPDVFIPLRFPPALSGAILGFVSALAANLGALGESAMKRSSHIKDSGSIIPGRGGVLDTIDSIALAAPVYFGVFIALFSIA